MAEAGKQEIRGGFEQLDKEKCRDVNEKRGILEGGRWCRVETETRNK